MTSFRKVSRGQVWYIVEKTPYNIPGDSLQSGSRPWLVVSNNACNQSSPVITIVPLTTQNKVTLPTHVEFQSNGKQNTILCEQPRSLPVRLLENASYKWTMSESTMRLVDEALAIHFGISLTFPNSEKFWESLERMVRVKVKQAIEASRVQAIDATAIACNIEKIVDSLIEPQSTKVPTIIESGTAQVPTIIESEPTSTPEPVKDYVPVKKSQRRKWTTQDMRTFLADCDKMPIKEVAAKYGIQVASVYGMKYSFKRTIGENNREETCKGESQ